MTNLEYMMAPCCPVVFKENMFTFASNKCIKCKFLYDYELCANLPESCFQGLNAWLNSEFEEDFWKVVPLISFE